MLAIVKKDGKITIPAKLRKKMGLKGRIWANIEPGDDGYIYITPIKEADKEQGSSK